MLKTRYLEDELEHLEKNNELYASQINLIKKNWHLSFNPTTNKYVYTDPTVVAELRAKLIATIPFQPQTEMERIELEEKRKTKNA